MNAPFRVTNIGAGEVKTDLATQWIARPADQRFLDLRSLREKTLERANASVENRVNSSALELIAPDPKTQSDIHRLSAGLPGGVERDFTHWSFGQTARLAKAPAGYLRTMPSAIVRDALSYSLRFSRGVEEIKTYFTDTELLAVTGPDYGRVYDHEVVEAVQQIAGNGTGDARWKIPGEMDWRTMIYDPNSPVTVDSTTLFASDRDVFMFLVDDQNPIEVGKVLNKTTGAMEPDLMFRGFYVTNSEVGSGSLKLAAFYLRAICCNRLMWGVEGFQELSIRHTSGAPDRFLMEATPALKSFADGSEKRLLDGVAKAKAAQVASNEEDALQFLKKRDFSAKKSFEILEAVEREEGYPARSVWDIAQGITAVARNELNTDTRMDMEIRARKMLDKVAA